jgi:hypothetical protein
MNRLIIDHATGKPYPVHVQPRLNTKIVNSRPTLTRVNESTLGLETALLVLILICVLVAGFMS